MFNKLLKREFITWYATDRVTMSKCINLFNRTEKYELQWGADLCTRTAEELKPMISEVAGIRSQNKDIWLTILKNYVEWCIQQRVPGAQNGMLSVTNDSLERMRRHTVANPVHLQKYLDSLYEPESSEQVDNTHRCYFWLAYMGVPAEDALQVKGSNVDFETMTLHWKGEDYPLYRESLPAFKNCVMLTSFLHDHKIYKVAKERIPGEEILRGFQSIKSLKSFIPRISTDTKKNEEIRLNYYRAWISGVFYRMYQNELAGTPPNFEPIVSSKMEGKEYKTFKKGYLESKKKTTAKDYLRDYNRWKLAHKMI